MNFCSMDFIFKFLPVTVILHWLTRGKLRNSVLFAGSLVFYFFVCGERTEWFLSLCVCTVFTYVIGLAVGKTENKTVKTLFFTFGVCVDAGALLFLKYSGALASVLTKIFSYGFSFENILIPAGFSFYIFKSISYMSEVYNKDAQPEYSFIDFGMYLTLFPQLIMGPIQSYKSFTPYLRERKVNVEAINRGLSEFIIGFGLKQILADKLSPIWSGIIRTGIDGISTPFAWLGMIAFALQIYFDFYGYSLMSRGIGEMFGYKTPDNFDYPYISSSMTEFFRKWHITLGQWFKENVYFPLGGSRCSKPRMYFNLFVVWLLTGIWHGNSLNFIIWGMFLFTVIAVEKSGAIDFIIKNKVVSHFYMAVLILVSWLIFKVDNLGELGQYLSRLVPFTTDPEYVYPQDWLIYFRELWWVIAAGILFVTPLPRKLYEKFKSRQYISVPVLLVIFWYSVYLAVCGENNPFMYTNF